MYLYNMFQPSAESSSETNEKKFSIVSRIENESDNYRLWVGGYVGNATDSLSAHNGYPFSTVDRNNDEAPKCCPCAPAYGGGWWFYRFSF